MKFRLKIPLLFFAVSISLGVCSDAFAGGDGIGRKIRDLKEDNSLLDAEMKLTSKGTSYIILDMRAESVSAPVRINLKNRGRILREFDVERIRYRRTKGLAIEPIPLVKKMAFSPPERKEIKPRKSEGSDDAAGEPEFLELKDMPSSYTLSFGKGLLLSITSRPKSLISRFFHLLRSTFVHIRYSLTIVWNSFRNREVAVAEIVMDKEAAQALYWSLDEGIGIVVMEAPL